MNQQLQRANANRAQARANTKKQGYDGPEDDLQKSCEGYAAMRGVRVIHVPNWIWLWILGKHPVFNSPPRQIKSWLKSTFIHLPDIIIWYKGESISFELKNKNGVLSCGQKKACSTMGVHVVRDTAEFKRILDDWMEKTGAH